ARAGEPAAQVGMQGRGGVQEIDHHAERGAAQVGQVAAPVLPHVFRRQPAQVHRPHLAVARWVSRPSGGGFSFSPLPPPMTAKTSRICWKNTWRLWPRWISL